jgi:hypothetical protein
LSRLSGLQWLSLQRIRGIRKEKLQLTCDEESISKFRKNEDNVITFAGIVAPGCFLSCAMANSLMSAWVSSSMILAFVFVGSKAPWDTICDGLPQFAGLPDDASA